MGDVPMLFILMKIHSLVTHLENLLYLETTPDISLFVLFSHLIYIMSPSGILLKTVNFKMLLI